MMSQRRAISLLEVILALAILGGSLAVLGEVVRVGTRSARESQALVYAQLHCESIMSELAAGVRYPEPVQQMQLEFGDLEYDWFYSIEVQPIDQEGFLVVRVNVFENKPAPMNPTQFSLVRWMVDPLYEEELKLMEQEMEMSMQPSSSSSGSSTSGGSSSSGSSSGGSGGSSSGGGR